ncbi:GNAT family N-acetyltransferase [soil metagenome]
MVDRIPSVHAAGIDTIDPRTLYRLLRLRSEVFVVEQACVYLDLDGRDLEAGCRLLWIEEEGRMLATLRLLVEPGGRHRIGRVATAVEARRRGLARVLVAGAVDLAGTAVVLDAQSHLAAWYGALGFTVDGADYVEDGIAHTPMRRAGPDEGPPT